MQSSELIHTMCLGHCLIQQPSEHRESLMTACFMSSLPFPTQYLGHVEVEESRGMHVCEDAVKKLKAVSEGLEQGGSKVRAEEAALTTPSVCLHFRWVGSP